MPDERPPRVPEWALDLLTERDLDLPVSFSKRDGRVLTLAEVLAAPEEMIPIQALPPDRQLDLAQRALARMPDFRLGLAGIGAIDRDRALAEIGGGTAAGRAVGNVVVTYLRDLVGRVVRRALPPLPPPFDLPFGTEPTPRATTGAGVLVIDGGDDGASPDLVSCRMGLYERLASRAAALVLCTGARATRDHVVAAATDDVGLIVGFGHGAPSEFYGRSGDDPVFSAADPSAVVVAGKIVHLTGCEAAAELGPELVAEHGALAFFGYADRFAYPASGEGATAAYECVSEINDALARGLTALEVHALAVRAFSARIARFQREDPFTAAIFRSMHDVFRSPAVDPSYGDEGACLARRPR